MAHQPPSAPPSSAPSSSAPSSSGQPAVVRPAADGPASASSTLAPVQAELLTRARADLRVGLPVLMRTDLPTDPGALPVAAAETLAPARLAALQALGPLSLTLTARRAQTLKLRPYDGDLVRITLPPAADVALLRALADPAADLAYPLKGPFPELRGGETAGHRAALALAKSAFLLPAVVALEPPAVLPAPLMATLTEVSAAAVAAAAAAPPQMVPVASARVPMALARAGRLTVFRSADGQDEHHAVEVGQPDRTGAVLVRLHSACFTGDVLGSLKCDCGPQLHAALARMNEEGAGVLLYLGQEGRGIGLANKMRAYSLQDQGFDTVEANHRLGFEDDERDFRVGAALLKRMGIARVRLLTNNPRKVEWLAREGIEVVERVPLKVGRGPLNTAYLDTKAQKSGHLL